MRTHFLALSLYFSYFCGEKVQTEIISTMRKNIFLLEAALLLLLVACSVKPDNEEALERVARLKYDRPDTALAILDSMKAGGQRLSHHDEMLWQLQRMDVENKLDTLFHTTADAQRLADYFDRHGSANEQMLAHYLLGRAYADTHEAPMALNCYMDAIEKADTTREDCDFKLLSRVCIQAGEVYHHQDLLQEWLHCIHQATHYELLTGDTLAAMRNYAYKSAVLDKMGKSDSALFVTEQVISFLSSHGQHEETAAWAGYCARKLVRKGQLPKAREYLDAYRNKSGYFDELGNIKKGKEVYYGVEGEYYLASGQMDSAEYYFRKELSTGKDVNNQNVGSKGLANVFRQTSRLDSALKYALYAYEMNDSFNSSMNAKSVKQIQSMFDYSRSLRIANEAIEKAHTRLLWLLLFGGISGVVIASLLFLYRSKVKEARVRYERLLLMEKENSLLRGDRSKATNPEQVVAGMDYFQTTNIWRRMQEMQVSTAAFPMKLTDEDWEELKREIETAWPLFMDKLRSLYPNLNKRQMRVCLLTKIGLKPKLVAELVDLSEQGVGSLKRRLYEKAFNEKGGTKDYDSSILLI